MKRLQKDRGLRDGESLYEQMSRIGDAFYIYVDNKIKSKLQIYLFYNHYNNLMNSKRVIKIGIYFSGSPLCTWIVEVLGKLYINFRFCFYNPTHQ